jgi:Tfp pilus assembly protein PilX
MRNERSRFNGFRRRGVAMVLVITVIGLATVLGFAMLSGAMLQSRTGGNATRSATAEYLAESGINLAMYYLQYPNRAPSLNAQGYWAGTGGAVAISSSVPGTVNVTVVRDLTDPWTYEVTSVGQSGTVSGTGVTRTQQARLYVRNQYLVQRAGNFNSSVTLYNRTTIDGDVASNSAITLSSGIITGTIYCTLLSGSSQSYQPAPATPASPTNSNINLYSTYSYQNSPYSASAVSVSSLTGTSGVTTLGTSGSNPAGVWVRTGDLTLNDNVSVAGTLVVNGNLTLSGVNVAITPQAGFPGLIVTGNVTVVQQARTTVVNGVAYIGGQLKTSGVLLSTPSSLKIYGGLLMGITGVPFATTYNATTYVKLDASMPKAPDLSSANRSPTGVSIVRWGPPVTPPY